MKLTASDHTIVVLIPTKRFWIAAFRSAAEIGVGALIGFSVEQLAGLRLYWILNSVPSQGVNASIYAEAASFAVVLIPPAAAVLVLLAASLLRIW